MNKNVDQSDALRDRLLSLITGKRNVRGAKRAELERELKGIQRHYERRGPPLTSDEAKERKLRFQKLHAAIVELLELHQQLTPDDRRELHFAAWARMNLRRTIEAYIDGSEPPEELAPANPKLIDAVLLYEVQNIEYQFGPMNRSPRKTHLRKHAIEPFLMLLEIFDLWKSAKPMTAVSKAFFDWLGVEQRHRLTTPGWTTIVREFKRDLKRGPGPQLLSIKHRFKRTSH